MIFNSLVLAYRNRPQHLVLFLAALAQCRHWEPYEIVIVDLGSTGTEEIVPFIDLPIRYHWIDYSGTFWKSKAINFGASKARGEFITALDVDCLTAKTFLEGIEAFFTVDSNRLKKLGHRVLMLDQSSTTLAVRYGIEWTDAHVLEHADKFPHYFYEKYQGKVTGNSQFTMLKEEYFRLGGLDEGFVGWGGEDHEFNLRAYEHLGPTKMSTSELFHLWHRREVEWDNSVTAQRTRARFIYKAAGNFAPLECGKDWGVFPTNT